MVAPPDLCRALDPLARALAVSLLPVLLSLRVFAWSIKTSDSIRAAARGGWGFCSFFDSRLFPKALLKPRHPRGHVFTPSTRYFNMRRLDWYARGVGTRTRSPSFAATTKL